MSNPFKAWLIAPQGTPGRNKDVEAIDQVLVKYEPVQHDGFVTAGAIREAFEDDLGINAHKGPRLIWVIADAVQNDAGAWCLRTHGSENLPIGDLWTLLSVAATRWPHDRMVVVFDACNAATTVALPDEMAAFVACGGDEKTLACDEGGGWLTQALVGHLQLDVRTPAELLTALHRDRPGTQRPEVHLGAHPNLEIDIDWPVPVAPLDAEAQARTPLSSYADRFKAASRLLLMARRGAGPRKRVIERPELDVVRRKLVSDKIVCLLGVPGSGKTALLSALAEQALIGGSTVLAIKADRLPPTVESWDDISEHLGLKERLDEAIRGASAVGPVLLLIDQLDALAQLIDTKGFRLNLLLDLVEALRGVDNLRIVLSCRRFECRYDLRLRHLEDDAVQLRLPSRAQVEPLLHEIGFDTAGWTDQRWALVQIPLYCDLFLRAYRPGSDLPRDDRELNLLEDVWRLWVEPIEGGAALLFKLARHLGEREKLWAGLQVFRRDPAFAALAQTGLLRVEDSVGPLSNAVTFAHQHIYQYVWARSLAESGTLLAYLGARRNSLAMRPGLWALLQYLRASKGESYLDEVRMLLVMPLPEGHHLHQLVLDFVASRSDPMDEEWEFIRPLLDQADAALLIRSMIEGKSYLDWMGDGLIEWALDDQDRRYDAAWSALFSIAGHRQDEPLETARRVVDTKPAGAIGLLRRLDRWSEAAVAVAFRAIRSAELVEYPVVFLLEKAVTAAPKQAGQIFVTHLRAQLEAASEPKEPREDEIEPVRAGPLNTAWHTLPRVVAEAPESFARALWGLLIEHMPRFVRQRARWPSRFLGDHLRPFDDRYTGPTPFTLLDNAIRAWADADSTGFRAFAAREADRGEASWLLPQRLICRGLAVSARENAVLGAEFLMGDDRRRELGGSDDLQADTVALLEGIVAVVDQACRARLIEWADKHWFKDHDPIVPSVRAVETYGDHQRAVGEIKRSVRKHGWRVRLRLLRVFDASDLPKRINLVAEERRFEGHGDLFEMRIGRSGPVASPLSVDEVSKAGVEGVLRFIEGKPNVFSLWQTVGKVAAQDPVFADEMLHALDPTTHPDGADFILNALVEGSPPADFEARMLALDTAGKLSPRTRQTVARGLTKVVGAAGLRPETIAMLEHWLSDGDRTAAAEDTDWSDTFNLEPVPDQSARPKQHRPVLFVQSTFGASSHLLDVVRALLASWQVSMDHHAVRDLALRLLTEPRYSEGLVVQVFVVLQLLRRLKREDCVLVVEAFWEHRASVLCDSMGLLLLGHAHVRLPPAVVARWIDRLSAHAAWQARQAAGEYLAIRFVSIGTDADEQRLDEALGGGSDPAIALGIGFGLLEVWDQVARRSLVLPKMKQFLTFDGAIASPVVEQIMLRDVDEAGRDSADRDLLLIIAHRPTVWPKWRHGLAKTVEGVITRLPEFSALVADRLVEDERMEAALLTKVALTLHTMPKYREEGRRLFERLARRSDHARATLRELIETRSDYPFERKRSP